MEPSSTYRENLELARQVLGGYDVLGWVCGGISREAVRRWYVRGQPPRTEYTGETQYAELIAAATGGLVSREDLLPQRTTARPQRRAKGPMRIGSARAIRAPADVLAKMIEERRLAKRGKSAASPEGD